MTPLLHIEKLTISFKGYSPVKEASLDIYPKEIVSIIGESGSGKTSLAYGILHLNKSAKLTGKIIFEEQDLTRLPEEKLCLIRGKDIGMIFQEPLSALNPLQKVGKQILESLSLHSLTSSPSLVLSLLKEVEFSNPKKIYNSYPHELSGGQRQRILIAMALAGKPKLLIADEPTTALDATVQKQILLLLKKINTTFGISILLITHNLNIIPFLNSRVYRMENGYLSKSTLAPTLKREFKNFSFSKNKILEVKKLSVKYKNFCALSPLSFSLYEKQTLGVIGESGSGKSTLGKAITRLIPASGNVFLNNQDFLSLSQKEVLKSRPFIQIVFQDADSSLNPRMIVKNIILEGYNVHFPKVSWLKKYRLLLELIKNLDLKKDVLYRYPHELSGGQKTRIALARSLILKPKILILDEITSALDITTQDLILNLLIKLQNIYSLSYIFIAHDLSIIQKFTDSVLVLKEGVCIEQGNTKKVFTDPSDKYTKELISSSLLK